MANHIVKVSFPWDQVSYAIHRGFDGKLLDWKDLDDLIDKDQMKALPEGIRELAEVRSDGTALFDTEEEAQQVIGAINRQLVAEVRQTC